MNEPVDAANYNWTGFVEFAEGEGINLENEDDYMSWWDCWKAGFVAGTWRS